MLGEIHVSWKYKSSRRGHFIHTQFSGGISWVIIHFLLVPPPPCKAVFFGKYVKEGALLTTKHNLRVVFRWNIFPLCPKRNIFQDKKNHGKLFHQSSRWWGPILVHSTGIIRNLVYVEHAAFCTTEEPRCTFSLGRWIMKRGSTFGHRGSISHHNDPINRGHLLVLPPKPSVPISSFSKRLGVTLL